MSEINWRSYSFIVVDKNGEEKGQIAYCDKLVCPRKGEYIWMPFNWGQKKVFKTTSFIVEDVCHHLNPDMRGTYDNIIVYCKPVLKIKNNTT